MYPVKNLSILTVCGFRGLPLSSFRREATGELCLRIQANRVQLAVPVRTTEETHMRAGKLVQRVKSSAENMAAKEQSLRVAASTSKLWERTEKWRSVSYSS